MATFLYRCPATGYNVQAIVSDHRSQAEGEVYEAVTCTACGRTHLVNLKTGRVAGAGRPSAAADGKHAPTENASEHSRRVLSE